MKELIFVTGNSNKFHTAEHICKSAGIKLKQRILEIDEIQGEDDSVIALDKAQKAFDIVNGPLVISDDTWSITGLNGWPGPYMKSMNHWLTPNNFLNLTKDLEDRTVYLNQTVVYQDKNIQKIFTNRIEGKLLDTVADFPGVPWMQVVSLTSDGRSLAEVRHSSPEQLATENTNVWHNVADWLQKRH